MDDSTDQMNRTDNLNQSVPVNGDTCHVLHSDEACFPYVQSTPIHLSDNQSSISCGQVRLSSVDSHQTLSSFTLLEETILHIRPHEASSNSLILNEGQDPVVHAHNDPQPLSITSKEALPLSMILDSAPPLPITSNEAPPPFTTSDKAPLTSDLLLQFPSLVSSDEAVAPERRWMRAALTLAEEALLAGEVPVGCVLVTRSPRDIVGGVEIVARGRNRVNETRNATRHAELVAVDDALARRVISLTFACLATVEVYVTVEPCVMCAAALRSLGAARVVYGAANERFGGCGSVLGVAGEQRLSPAAAGGALECVGGVMGEEAVALLKRFYVGENPNAPAPKRKEGRTPCGPGSYKELTCSPELLGRAVKGD